MSLAIIRSRAPHGVEAVPVSVEVHLSNGLPAFAVVGMAETAVKESKDRVRSAILNAGFDFPAKRITVNLAPADLPKESGRFDLAVAVGILAASDQLRADELGDYDFYGELALDGAIRPVKGLVPALASVKHMGLKAIVPEHNAEEAGFVRHGDVYTAGHLLAVTALFNTGEALEAVVPAALEQDDDTDLDMRDVRGQHGAKRALQIAAAGGHNLLMIGPPGSGKTMLAMRLPGLHPPLNDDEALEVAAIHSVAGQPMPVRRARIRPFRRPHHSSSAVSLVGGGGRPRPGEISLSHLGVLFLDELPEFSRHALEQLREPLEAGVVHISRALQQVTFPARFQLIAAMNPCPCGYLGEDRCRCTPDQIQRYRARISGPLLDRIDIHVEVPAVPHQKLREVPAGESSCLLRREVAAARERQFKRQDCLNSSLAVKATDRHCALERSAADLLERAMAQLDLSARAYYRILRLARTVADLRGDESVDEEHVAEAIQLRTLDRRQ